ncbi:MAG: shikimate dehydrogenase, partial [Muribaculaceae bacterium]|nr:shikimate dehydrogenase [Muribaculaceae bacterium]
MYGLIGRPLGHSFSANYFNKKFAEENIDEEYRLFPLESIEDLPDLLRAHPDLKGLNVTIPYKQDVIKYLNALSEDAAQIGAVNVIKITDSVEGKVLEGFNSDALGFRQSILPLIKPHMKNALVLGTGGASKAVSHVLKNLGLNVKSVSRRKTETSISYEEVTPALLNSYYVIVNSTPLGMWPHVDDAPRLPYESLTSRHLLYD